MKCGLSAFLLLLLESDELHRRNYYGESASYLAASGEVLESRGRQGVKQRILLEYKKLYSRRRAFHVELRKYGMMKGKLSFLE